MKETNLSWVALLAIAAIVGFLFLAPHPEPNDTSLPALDLTLAPAAVHPPAQIRLSTNITDFPTGTKLTYNVNGIPLPQGSAVANVATWPTTITATAKYNEKTATAEQQVSLINRTPIAHNLFFSEPPYEDGRIRFNLRYRQMGCDGSGAFTDYSGIEDPDYSDMPDYFLTDNWAYHVSIIELSTGKEEAVYTEEGGFHVIGPDEFTTRSAFLWVPYHSQGEPLNRPFIAGLDYSINAPAYGTMSVPHETTEDEYGEGYIVVPDGQTTIGPMCGPVTPPPEPPVHVDFTHEMTVLIKEFGEVRSFKYKFYASPSNCN